MNGAFTMSEKANICPTPFYHCEISYNGDITSCCPVYCNNYKLGNLLETSLDQIWRGERAQNFRDHILCGDYSLCNMKYCTIASRYTRNEIHACYYNNTTIKLPQRIIVGYDYECNLACNICRKKIIKNSANDLERLKKIENSYLSWLGDCKTVLLSGGGDPFGSEYARGLIGRIITTWSKIQLEILTNGVLLTPAMYFGLGLDKRVSCLSVSIHAATSSVYRKITRSNDFAKLQKNLAFFSDLIKEGSLPKLRFNFVVCQENYREMPAFVEMAAQYGADCAFTVYRDLHREPFHDNYNTHAVYQENNSEYCKLLEILKHNNFNNPLCSFDGILKKLHKNANRSDNSQCECTCTNSQEAAGKEPASASSVCENDAICLSTSSGCSTSDNDIFAGLELERYQKSLLLRFHNKYSFENEIVIEMGSDISLSTAQGILRLGASKVYAINPAFPDNMVSPDKRIIPIKSTGENANLHESCADVIFGIALLEHVHEIESFAKECKRMLKPDGICFLQGNPMWTCAVGHHTYIRNIPGSGNSYVFTHTTPWEDWEHLCITTRLEAEHVLRQRRLPETDIPVLVHNLMDDPHISKRTPSEIVDIFLKVFGYPCAIKRQNGRNKPNDFFNIALKKYKREDLVCEDIQIIYTNSKKFYKTYDWFPIISLGHTPFPAHFLNLSGIRDVQNSLDDAMPFDYAYHPVSVILRYLRNNFMGYFEDIEYDSVKNYWINKEDGILFNHDGDCGPNDLEVFLARIKKRIDTFQKMVSSPESCVFVFSTYFLENAEAIVNDVFAAVKTLRSGRPFLFITLGSKQIDKKLLSHEIYIIQEDFPCSSMEEWWKIETQESCRGKVFISNLSDKIKTALKPVAALLLSQK